MSDLVAERISVAELHDTGVSLALTLQSKVLTAADVRAALTVINGIADAINAQLHADPRWFDAEGHEFHVVPEVRFEHGSLKIIARLKSSYKKISGETKIALATITAAIIMSVDIAGPAPPVPEPAPIVCTEAVDLAIGAWQEAQQDAEKYDNKVSLTIEVECEGQSYVFTIGDPDSPNA